LLCPEFSAAETAIRAPLPEQFRQKREPVLRPELRLNKERAIPAKVGTGFASGIASEQGGRAIPVNRISPEIL
jgi:hypothetical protein